MKPLVCEVCPRPGDNEIRTRCFYISIRVTGHDVVVHGVVGRIVADHQVATGINVDSAIVAERGVTINAASAAGDVDAGAVTRASTVTLAGVTFHTTKIIHLDAIACVSRSRASSHCAARGRHYSNSRITARVTVTNCARSADRDAAAAILFSRRAGNKGPFRARYAKSRVEMFIAVDHG